MNRFEWIKDIPNADVYIDDMDAKLLFTICNTHAGIDCFISLFDSFLKTPVLFSETKLFPLKVEYIKLFYDGTNVNQLARLLGLTDRSIYNIINKKYQDKKQLGLFEHE